MRGEFLTRFALRRVVFEALRAPAGVMTRQTRRLPSAGCAALTTRESSRIKLNKAEVLAKAEELMSSSWNSDVDGLEFRRLLERSIEHMSRSRGDRLYSLIDKIIGQMSRCSEAGADARAELDDNGGDEEDEDYTFLRDVTQKYHSAALRLLEQFLDVVQDAG